MILDKCLKKNIFPVPPIILLTDMVSRCRLLAAHGLRSCLSVRTQPLTATGAFTDLYHTIPYHRPKNCSYKLIKFVTVTHQKCECEVGKKKSLWAVQVVVNRCATVYIVYKVLWYGMV